MPNRPSKKARRAFARTLEAEMEKHNRRSELLYRELRGEILSEDELRELEVLTEWERKNSPCPPSPLSEDVMKAIEEVEKWMAAKKAPND